MGILMTARFQQSDFCLDANGTTLQNGDNIIVLKNLPLRGAPSPLKAGTKVKNIRLTKVDHNITCKIDGWYDGTKI